MMFWGILVITVGIFIWLAVNNDSAGTSAFDNDAFSDDDSVFDDSAESDYWDEGFSDHSNSSLFDEPHCPSINPANGLPMVDCSIDIEGNPYGTDSDNMEWSSGFDDGWLDTDDSFSSFDDDFSSFDNDW